MDISSFKHKITVTVRFNEIDMLGVCNNAVYVNYFEHARLKYVKEAGLVPEKGLFTDGRLFFMVRNEINYRGHSHFDDQLDVYSKITYIKNSSFGFDHLIVNKKTGEIIVDGKGVVVHVDSKTRKSSPLPEIFYEKLKAFEESVEIIRSDS
jgi:acyl-CoA thioester hydrolase